MNNKTLENTSLTLFFTGGISLKTWHEVGNIDRELEIYKRLGKELKRVNMVTYGGKGDRLYAKELDGVNLLSTVWYKNAPKRTLFNLLLRYLPQIYRSDVLRTNQILGSEIPIWLKRKFGKKLIIRCGYLYSYITKQRSKDEQKIINAIQLEKNAFSFADIGIVTSSWQRDLVIKQYNVEPRKIRVIPNYVVTDVFKPYSEIKKMYDLVFVGRAGEEKNLV
ncbi:unnamed protein product, partial [marine sediment metagenome]